ncbi:hypothetical protein [Lutibacter sp. B1]|uniref:hypothetical protein n=1 Tax=Lutibacter sp. B1 TaxID=2725996 RepID=UPI001456EDB8|nr:hypothetical protein [Lutibacter sp. B1]NLP58358.1 hypothetical protein [Lutibacter sp. B1]
MKRLIPKQSALINRSVENLLEKTQFWISEIEFIKKEQAFLKELISQHLLELCSAANFSKTKLYLNGIEQEDITGSELTESVKNHQINLGLLIENMYLKREDEIRRDHELLKTEVKNYIQNFKYLKEQIFEIILDIMKKEKKAKLFIK